MALALEGTPQHANGSGTSLALPAFTTSQAAMLFIATTINDATVTSISGGSLTWTLRSRQDNGSGKFIELWSAPASGAVAGEAYTVNYNSSAGYATADVFAFAGQDTSGTPFDGNASVPAKSNGPDPIAISTDNADDVIIACFRESSTASPTEGTGFTKISGADYQLVEYKIVAATQSSLSCTQGTGAGDSNGCIADALKAAAGGGGTTRGAPFGARGTAFNGGKTFMGILR